MASGRVQQTTMLVGVLMAAASAGAQTPDELKRMSLEELMHVEHVELSFVGQDLNGEHVEWPGDRPGTVRRRAHARLTWRR